jgi:3-hydroxybutyrate dehydrogenase
MKFLEFVKTLDKIDVLFNAVGFVHHGSILRMSRKKIGIFLLM